MRPGNTSLPVTSTTSRALVGRMLDCMAAILPSRIATSLIPSMPEDGQVTRPPRSSISKVALMDMVASLSGRRHPAASEIRSMLRISRQQSLCQDRKGDWLARIELCVKENPNERQGLQHVQK